VTSYRPHLQGCTLLGYHAASSGNSLPTFRDNLSAPSSGVEQMGPKGCPEMSARNYHYSLRNSPEERSYPLGFKKLKGVFKATVTPSNGSSKAPFRRLVSSLTSLAACRHWGPRGLRSQPPGSAEQAAPRTVALCHAVAGQSVTCKQHGHCYHSRSCCTSQHSCRRPNGTQFHMFMTKVQ
jgi:hypothetical protein